jgi:thioredoxin 1
VACLCAQWCGTCRDYRSVFDQALSGIDHHLLRKAWVDVEDHADALGNLDIENFPTLLIARGDEVLFFGTVMPHAATLARMVRSALDGSLPPGPTDAESIALPGRVRTLLDGGVV